jgi:hypothetical protein
MSSIFYSNVFDLPQPQQYCMNVVNERCGADRRTFVGMYSYQTVFCFVLGILESKRMVQIWNFIMEKKIIKFEMIPSA